MILFKTFNQNSKLGDFVVNVSNGMFFKIGMYYLFNNLIFI